MNKIFILVGENTYENEEILGVFSSEEKASIARELSERYDGSCIFQYAIRPYEVDEELVRYKGDLEQELDGYKECASLLERLNRVSS